MRKGKKLQVILTLLMVAYFGSYLWLSRRGYAEAGSERINGFYYFFPEDTRSWRSKNYGCVILFSPLNYLDRSLGFGRYPSCEPLWGLSKQEIQPVALPT
jgi:hypothetical protein